MTIAPWKRFNKKPAPVRAPKDAEAERAAEIDAELVRRRHAVPPNQIRTSDSYPQGEK